MATVTWIGGITFILFVALPSSRQVLGPEAGSLMAEISKRFTPLANCSIVVLVATGIGLTVLDERFSGTGFFLDKRTLVLSLKHVLVFVMVVVHFYRGLILNPRIGKTASAGEKTSLQKLSLRLVKANFAIGVTVLLLSGITSVGDI
jgi:uncharacterized membrane protein